MYTVNLKATTKITELYVAKDNKRDLKISKKINNPKKQKRGEKV